MTAFLNDVGQFLVNHWPLTLSVALLAIGGVGVWLDREHRRNLDYRRGEIGHLLVSDLRSLPGQDPARRDVAMVHGEVVLAANRLITFFGGLKQLFGGEVRSFHDVITRARQEAVLRALESAAESGFDAVGNLRVEPVDVAGVTVNPGRARQRGLFVGVIAYATAYHRAPGLGPPPASPTLQATPQ